ncbi:MAG TPA: hypothetical protein VK590_07875 [Saprospiraceae bacterium]|nr:hypothetical protein [Saprospiraceae bacterium]
MEKNAQNPPIRIEFGCSERVKVIKYYTDFADPNSIENKIDSYFDTLQDKNKYLTNQFDKTNDDNEITIYIEQDDGDNPMLQNNLFPGKKLVGPMSYDDKKKFVWVRVLDDNIIKLLSKVDID